MVNQGNWQLSASGAVIYALVGVLILAMRNSRATGSAFVGYALVMCIDAVLGARGSSKGVRWKVRNGLGLVVLIMALIFWHFGYL
jgi:hypothetical protein